MAKNKGGFIGQDGLNAPDSPTGVSATAGEAKATISFTAPSDVGGSAITGYRAQSNDGIGASGSSSPIEVTGLTNGTSYTFSVWAINAFGYSAPSDASGSVSPAAARGLFGGGLLSGGSPRSNVIDYITISSTGNATDFGDLINSVQDNASCASSSRGIFWGGNDGGDGQTINYVTISSTGNASDFGNLDPNHTQYNASCSSQTRGLIGSKSSDSGRNISYITIASTGNSGDFGQATSERSQLASFSSPTRGVWGGGTSDTNIIDYVTIASLGNASDFGDLTQGRQQVTGASNSTRGLFAGGGSNTIDYVTIASTGNATDFGNLLAFNG